MIDREKTSYRWVRTDRLHPLTQDALARLNAHQYRMFVRQRYFCWALVETGNPPNYKTRTPQKDALVLSYCDTFLSAI